MSQYHQVKMTVPVSHVQQYHDTMFIQMTISTNLTDYNVTILHANYHVGITVSNHLSINMSMNMSNHLSIPCQ